MKVQIESRVLGDLAINHIVPTAVIYQNRLLETYVDCAKLSLRKSMKYSALTARN